MAELDCKRSPCEGRDRSARPAPVPISIPHLGLHLGPTFSALQNLAMIPAEAGHNCRTSLPSSPPLLRVAATDRECESERRRGEGGRSEQENDLQLAAFQFRLLSGGGCGRDAFKCGLTSELVGVLGQRADLTGRRLQGLLASLPPSLPSPLARAYLGPRPPRGRHQSF